MPRGACRVALLLSVLALRASADTDLRGAVFRSVNDAPIIKIVSADELELTPDRDGPNLVCKYSRDGDSLRVIATILGSPQAIYFKFVPEGLQRADGTFLYDAGHFEAAARAAKEAEATREREAAARAAKKAEASPTPIVRPSVAPILSISAAKAFAVAAPTPVYPYEARAKHITGSGVVKLVVDPRTGSVTSVTMVQSIGNPMLDYAALSTFRRWRFEPGSVREVQIPITYTMAGASY